MTLKDGTLPPCGTWVSNDIQIPSHLTFGRLDYKEFGVKGLGFRRNGKEHGNYYNGLYRDYHKDPFLRS